MTTLVFLETHDGEPTKGGLGVLSKAAALGAGEVSAAVLGTGVATRRKSISTLSCRSRATAALTM